MKKIGIILTGGLGDILLTTPAIHALKDKYHNHKLIVIINDYSYWKLLFGNPFIDEYCFSNTIKPYRYFDKDETIVVNSWGEHLPYVNYKELHAVEIIGKLFNVEIKTTKPEYYFQSGEINTVKKFLNEHRLNNFILINTTGKCSIRKNWIIENWEKLIKHFPNKKFIHIGSKYEQKITGAFDLRGKTSIRGAVALLSQAKLFIGIESFLGHAARAVDTKSIILFGPTTPTIVGYKENINIYKNLNCSPCFTEEIIPNSCIRNYTCMKSILVDEVASYIDELHL